MDVDGCRDEKRKACVFVCGREKREKHEKREKRVKREVSST